MTTSQLDRRILGTYSGEPSESLSRLCLDLFEKQRQAWPDLRAGCESLEASGGRPLGCNGFSVRLQHNPRRIRSTTADPGNKGESPSCFLCLDRLPEDQKGILYRGEYLILCNPMPVLSLHLTVSHVVHQPQAVAEKVPLLLRLMADGSGWMVLYNGPRCGASAPDHLHFQAAPSGQMPIEREIQDEKRLRLTFSRDGIRVHRVRDLGRELILLTGEDPIAMATVFNRFLMALKDTLHAEDEPLINLAGSCIDGTWRLMIFPRRRHRPEAYYRQGDDRVVVSPGIVEMGGIIVTPVERDFNRLDATAVKAIFQEVSLEPEVMEVAIDHFRSMS